MEEKSEVILVEDFIGRETCDFLSDYAKKAYTDGSMMISGSDNEDYRSELLFNPRDILLLYKIVNSPVTPLYRSCGRKVIEFLQSPKVIYDYEHYINYYPVGGYIVPHIDNEDMPEANLTSVVYLNNSEEYEGGEIYFPSLDLEFKPSKGSVLLFPPEYVHGVRKITKGVKLSMSINYTDNPEQKLDPRGGNVY